MFLFSSKLWGITWDIGKALIYLIIGLFALNIVNPSFAQDAKSTVNDFINIGFGDGILVNILSRLSKWVMSFFMKPEQIKQLEKIPEEKKEEPKIEEKKVETFNLNYDILKFVDNRDLVNSKITNNRNNIR